MPRLLALPLLLSLQAIAAGAQALPAAPPATLGFAAGRLERITPVVQAAIDSGRMQGAVVLVARRGRVAYHKAFGWADRESGRRMTSDALFRIASQTKAVTSVAVMTLIEDGRLRLGDPVSKFLPGFAGAGVAQPGDTGILLQPVKRAITIRDLLTHTAGLSYGTDSLVRRQYEAQGLGPAAGWGWYFADKSEPICGSMERLSRLPLVSQPGERYVYGYSTDVLGCVVERVSGQSLADYLETRIFRPLGMRNTWFFPPAAAAARLATVYSATDSGLVRSGEGPRGQGDYLDGPRVSYSGGAGLVSTARDYALFLQMLAGGGSLGATRILGPRTVALMTTDHADTLFSRNGMGFGLGFEILEDPGRAGQYGNVGRYGWGGAYATSYWIDPKDELVVVLMTQLLPGRAWETWDQVRAVIYQAIAR